MKITKQYLKKVIKEELHASLEEENVEEGFKGAVAGIGLAALTGLAGMKVADQVKQFKQIMTRVEQDRRSYEELSAIYKKDTGRDPREDRMDPEDLKIYTNAKEIKK